MSKFVLIALLVVSTVAFADEMNSRSNVYDFFKQGSGTQNTPEEEATAQIKRYMANLLYPVDMSSLNGPDKDAKFRDLIIILQQQMGVSPTGVLTTEQFLKLEEAARYVDGDFVGMGGTKYLSIDRDLASASGTGITDASPCSGRAGGGCDIGQPINFVRIFCFRARGICERWVASFDLKERFLFLDDGTEYEIDSWTSSQVTATEHTPCATFLMTIDVRAEQVTIMTVPQTELSTCKGFLPPDRPSTWKLVDGFPVAMKLSEDRKNAARSLVYPPARRLLPIQ